MLNLTFYQYQFIILKNQNNSISELVSTNLTLVWIFKTFIFGTLKFFKQYTFNDMFRNM